MHSMVLRPSCKELHKRPLPNVKTTLLRFIITKTAVILEVGATGNEFYSFAVRINFQCLFAELLPQSMSRTEQPGFMKCITSVCGEFHVVTHTSAGACVYTIRWY